MTARRVLLVVALVIAEAVMIALVVVRVRHQLRGDVVQTERRGAQ